MVKNFVFFSAVTEHGKPPGPHVETKRKAYRDLIAFTYPEEIEPQTDPRTNRTQTTSGGGLSTVRLWVRFTFGSF